MDERFNQTLQNMLVKFVSIKKEPWSAYLDTCVVAYNTSWHESTKFTPFELMFGRKAILPIDVELQNASPEEVCQKFHTLDEPNTSAIFREHAQCLETAKQNILVAQLKQKENYDQKHAKPERFQVNKVVLKKDFTRKKTKRGKLKERYLGPYTITNVLPYGTYELADPSNKSKTLRATGAHLKPYTVPSPPHEENVSGKGVSKECSEIKDEAFILSPHPEDEVPRARSLSFPPNEDEAFILSPLPKEECPENNISLSLPNGDELQPYEPLTFSSRHRDESPQKKIFTILPPRDELLDEDELSFLNLSIPILPPPMPSLQLLHHAPLPPAAPLACSTPRITTPSPSPPPQGE